ncbi:hypothetical protein U1Q18_046613 [Sarracenia purpurea var. burkii]
MGYTRASDGIFYSRVAAPTPETVETMANGIKYTICCSSLVQSSSPKNFFNDIKFVVVGRSGNLRLPRSIPMTGGGNVFVLGRDDENEPFVICKTKLFPIGQQSRNFSFEMGDSSERR